MAGKTVVFCQVLKQIHAKGKKAIVVVYGKDLVENASQRLFREGIPHGVLQGNHWNYRPREPIQVCSITTLFARKLTPEADIIILDEAHMTQGKSYEWFLSHYKNCYMLPVTATPHLKGGMRHVADTVVYPTTIQNLMADGYLVRPRYFAPTSLDLSDVKIDKKTGDYLVSDLAKKIDGTKIYGDVVSHYKEICKDAPAVCFAINIDHSNLLCDLFNSHGIPAVHIDADTPLAERQAVYQKLESGELKVVVNVGVATTGVDIPCLRAVIMCRPTKSYNLYIQAVGRGTRPYPGKDVFFVLDHANNIAEHGFIEDEQECNLDGLPKKESVRRPKICEACYFTWMPAKPGESCPECGHQNVRPEKAATPLKSDDKAKLKEVKSKEDLERIKLKSGIDKIIERTVNKGYKPGWAWHKVKDKYDEKTAKIWWTYIKAKIELHTDS